MKNFFFKKCKKKFIFGTYGIKDVILHWFVMKSMPINKNVNSKI